MDKGTDMAAKKGEIRPWADVEEKLPSKHGWYAVQDNTVEGQWYIDAYWDGTGWWTFGRHVTLHVKKEIRGVLRWRYFNDEEKKHILAEEASAVVPNEKQVNLKSSFMKRLFLLHKIAERRRTQAQLVKDLNWPRRTVGQMLDALELLGVTIARNASEQLFVVDWGPINHDWVKKNLELIEETM